MKESPPLVSAPQSKTSALAITSLVLGILGVVFTLVCLGVVFAIPAVICGHIACSRIGRSAGQLGGQGLAIAGFICGYAGIGMCLLLLPIAIPNFVRARDTAQRNACINNLRQIECAKRSWALEQKKSPGDRVAEADITGFLQPKNLKCPKGGVYTIGPVGEDPTCSIAGHELPR